MRLRFVCLALLALSACAGDVPAGEGIALRDPLGLIDDVYAAGHALRLYVLPAASFTCEATTGMVTPEPPDSPDPFPDAVVDVTLAMADAGGFTAMIPPGDYVVLVRGKGTDIVSGRPDVFIATGCTNATVADGETVGATVMLAPIVSMGECGDGRLSPDEQCEAGDVACTECRTTAEMLNTTTALPQVAPRVAWSPGQRALVAWETDARDIGFRLFSPEGRPLTGMGPLAVDTTVDTAGSPAMPVPGPQNAGGVAVAPDGRIALSLVDFSGGTPDVRVAFFSTSLMAQGVPQARDDRAGTQNAPVIAFHSSGAAMVAFQDTQSATGLSGRVFAAGATTPEAGEAFAVGTGSTGGSAPAIAATASGFVVAFVAGGDVRYQRFGADGAPADAEGQPVGDPGGRGAPAVAALADGTFLIAWTESDGMGSGIRARIFSDAGTPATPPFAVNDTIAGEQVAPAVAATSEHFLVAFQSGASVRARGFSAAGDPSLNREQPPTLGDFEVAAAGARPSVGVIGTGAAQAWWVIWEAAGTDSTDVFGRRFPL